MGKENIILPLPNTFQKYSFTTTSILQTKKCSYYGRIKKIQELINLIFTGLYIVVWVSINNQEDANLY
jgi:hypothetical protein